MFIIIIIIIIWQTSLCCNDEMDYMSRFLSRMMANPPVKLKWLEHLNAVWVSEGSEVISSRDGVSSLYNRLLSNQEVVTMPHQVLHLKGPPLPDFEQDSPSQEEQEHYLNSLLSSQLALARAVCSDSPFSAMLQKRLIVLQRVFYAVANKYHDRDKVWQIQQDELALSNSDESKANVDRSRSGTDALIEMGVKTGLSLIFSLLRQHWLAASAPGGIALCNNVLQTALEVVCSLAPLSLANESKLPSLGLNTLTQVTTFLKSVTMPNSSADFLGKRLSCELVLALGAQRGSLRYLLEWIEMALCASAAADIPARSGTTRELRAGSDDMNRMYFSDMANGNQPSTSNKSEETPAKPSDSNGGVFHYIDTGPSGMITFDIFMQIMKQMKKTAVSVLSDYCKCILWHEWSM